jgi:hypothetical protein
MIGTSRTGFGLDARLVEERMAKELGRPALAFNFGVPATGPVVHLLYFRRLLEAGHKPDLLLVEVLPSSLAILDRGPLEDLYISGDRLRYSEVDAAIGYDFPAREPRLTWWKSIVSPWYTLRFQLLGRAANGWLPWQYRMDCGRAADARGWIDPLANSVAPAKQKEAFAAARIQYGAYLGGMFPGGGAGRALADLLDLARERGIPVKLVVMPESNEFRTMYHPDVEKRFTAFLTDVCAKHGGEWIDARRWLPDEVFYDGHHLLRPGAEAFSAKLADAVIVPFFKSVREER